MNRKQKSSLRRCCVNLAKDLDLDEDIYTAVRTKKLFTDTKLSKIKNEKTPKKRVCKLLELLEECDETAFDGFIEILMENYKWLADELKDTYRQLQESARQSPSVKTSANSSQDPCLSQPVKSASANQLEFRNQEKNDFEVKDEHNKICRSVGVSPIQIIESKGKRLNSRICVEENKKLRHASNSPSDRNSNTTDEFDRVYLPVALRNEGNRAEYRCNEYEANIDDDDDASFLPSEVFYKNITMYNSSFRGSQQCKCSRFENIHVSVGTEKENPKTNNVQVEESENIELKEAKAQNKQNQTDMRIHYINIQQKLNNSSKYSQTEHPNDVSWKMIHDALEQFSKSCSNLHNDQMIKECCQLFQETGTQLPLKQCITNLKKDIEKLITDNKKTTDHVYKISVKIRKLKQDKDALQNEKIQLEKRVQDLNKELTRINNCIEEKDITIQALKKESNENLRKIEQLEKKRVKKSEKMQRKLIRGSLHRTTKHK